MVMVDSGNQITMGYLSFYNEYKAMVDAAMARPPQANIQANWWRTGDAIEVYAQVENLSGATLSGANGAVVHVIVYEDSKVVHTNRIGRATAEAAISDLANGAAKTFRLQTADLAGVNWDKLHVVVLADYRPTASAQTYDTLQAVMASKLDVPFASAPTSLSLVASADDTADPWAEVNLQGPSFVNWTATTETPWLTVTPTSGPMPTPARITATRGSLAAGWQDGTVTFKTADGLYSAELTVRAYMGALERIYLPNVIRE
jgi:hypothetical protein